MTMPPQKPDRFDRIDWDEHADSAGFDFSVNTIGLVCTTLPIAALAAYDRWLIGEREATFEALGRDLGLGSVFTRLGIDYDPGALEYLFVFTLLVFVWYLSSRCIRTPG